VNAVIFLWNISPTTSVSGMTPHQAYTGRKPLVSRLRALGCPCWVTIEKVNLDGKLSKRAIPCIMVGYQPYGRGTYRCYNPEGKKVKVSRDVFFDERPISRTGHTDEGEIFENSIHPTEISSADREPELSQPSAASKPSKPIPTTKSTQVLPPEQPRPSSSSIPVTPAHHPNDPPMNSECCLMERLACTVPS
jgi:hypothetical protein